MTAVKNQVGTVCGCCELPATRETVDEYGQRLPLCDRCPSPDEIRRRAARVREGWDKLEHWCRRHGVSRLVGMTAQVMSADAVERTSAGGGGRCVDALARIAL